MLGPGVAATMARDVCRGMAYLHGFTPPLLHRDLKSSNLLCKRRGRIRCLGRKQFVPLVSRVAKLRLRPTIAGVFCLCGFTRPKAIRKIGLQHFAES